MAEGAPHSPAPPTDYHPGWDDLVDDFSKGGLTPAQYASFALAGIFIILLLGTFILAIHASRRANTTDAESSQAAIGRWKDGASTSDIVRPVPEPPRLYKSQSQSQSRTQVPPVPTIPGHGNVRKGFGVLGHMRRYSEERRAGHGHGHGRGNEKQRGRSRSVDREKVNDRRYV